MKRKQLVGRKNHSRSRTWLAGIAFAGATMAPLSAFAQFGPAPSFGTATNFAAQNGPQSVAVANFNDDADSFLDMAVVNFSSDSVSVFLGNGSGGFGAAVNVALGAGNGPVDIAAADVNGDGNMDIVTANGTSSKVSVLLGDGLGGFTQPVGSPFASGGTTSQGIAVGEVTGDAFVDVVVANSASDNISVLAGNGTGVFGAPTNYAVGAGPRDIALARLNPDGLLDVVVANFGSGGGGTGGSVSVLLNVAGVLGTAVTTPTGNGARTVAVGNLNADAFADIVVTNRFTPNISVLLGVGDGTFLTKTDYAAGNEPFGLAIGDFNMDNKADVAVSNFLANTVTLLSGDGAGVLQTGLPTLPTTGLSAIGVGAGDFSGDGKLDLAIPNFDSANVSVFLNTLVRQADLSVTKTDGVTTVAPGALVTYTLTVSNAGPNVLNQITLTDTVPAALTSPVFTPATGSYNSGTGAWTGINLVPGGSVTMTLSGTVNPTATGSLVNGVAVAVVAPDTEANTADNTASDTDTLVRRAELTVTKTDGQTNATPGSAVSYTITVSSAGPSTLGQINLVDTLPASLQSPVFTPATGSYNSGTGAWTGITLASGGSVTMTVGGTISATATGNLVNSVAVAVVAPDTESTTADNTASDTDTLVRRAELTITKTDGQANATPGSAVTYTITVSSAGPSTLSQINLVDTLPAALQSPVFTPGTGSYDSGTGAWTGITLASGGSVTMTVGGTISATATGNLVNSVAVAVVAPDTEGNTANNAGSDTDTLVRRAELTVTKTDGQTTAAPGSAVSYTITVSSAGPSTLTQVNLVDTLPAALQSPVFTPGTGSYNSGTGAWTGITLASGGSVSMTVAGTISAAATGTLVNSVAVAVVAPDTETNTANNTASDSDTLVLSADVAITKTGPALVAPGQNVTYTISVTNNGPSNAAGVTVADTTPVGVTFVSNSGDCVTAFPCTLGALTAGQSRTITTTFAIGAGFAGATLSNTATVTATTPDPVSANNTSTATSNVTNAADLAITKVGPVTVTRGQDAVYTITVTNNGPANSTAVEVADATPTGLTFVSNSGDCVSAFPCSLGTLGPGSTRTITATFAVPAGYAGPGPVQNTATVSSSSTDPNLTDNTATASAGFGGLAFHTLSPCRVLDTRDPANAPALAPGPARTFAIAGVCSVPATAQAVSINVTVTSPTDPGDLRIYPAGTTPPLASAVNYGVGQTRANNAVVKLGATGNLEVLTDQGAGTVHFILDVNGYFE